MVRYSPEYVEHLKQGPFPGRIDPWAEIGHYLHQIHGGMIDQIVDQLAGLLLNGYLFRFC